MKNILITGSTGNVGKEIIKCLIEIDGDYRILKGLRNLENVNDTSSSTKVKNIHFDFEDKDSISKALGAADVLFLLRPPQLANIEKYFEPLLNFAIKKSVGHIVLLSVQGADRNSFIPHHKIEKLILESNIPHTFLRPAYFMQNFTTILRKDLVEKNLIYLPAGNVKFTLVDVTDIGKVGAKILSNTKQHCNVAYDLTSEKALNFREMASLLSVGLDKKIRYESPNLLSFFLRKKREGIDSTFILIMIMLHYLPRFHSTPPISDKIKKLMGNEPTTFKEFVIENKALLTK